MNFWLKITRGELDKIFVRPAIFVMTGFFIIAIVLSLFLFNPTERNDYNDLANIQGESVLEVYNNFYNNQNKIEFDKDLTFTTDLLNFYLTKDNAITKSMLLENFQKLNNVLNAYKQNIIEKENIQAINENLGLIKIDIESLMAQYDKAKNQYLFLLIKNNNNEKILNGLNQLNNIFNTFGDSNDIEFHKRLVGLENEKKCMENINKALNGITEVEVNKSILDDSQLILSQTQEKSETILLNFQNLYDSALNDDVLNKSAEKVATAKQFADNYKSLLVLSKHLISDKIILNVTSDYSNSQIKSYINPELKSFNRYEIKENIVRNQYLFNNDSFRYQYANVFNSNTSSNEKTNAYDFMFFALEFLSFVIIIFCVVIGSTMISGESTSGTLKMLAIRPYKRHKIVTGKLSATMFLGIIFLMIGTLASFLIGLRLYGMGSAPILVIFNAQTATTMSASALFMIYLLTLLFRIFFYSILAIFISTAFRSNIGAIIISVLIYLFIALFGNIFGESVFYGYLPFANVDMFRFLGGEFVNSSGNILGIDFSSPILPDSNFYISLIISVIFVTILTIATYIIFKKRDIS